MAYTELRWGIIGTGWIAGMFVTDLLAPRDDASIKHTITAIGSSSNLEKGQQFAHKFWNAASVTPNIYASYQEVYDAPDVDVVYIATPHSLHRQNCLDAIAAGKNVLCEKPFTINSREAAEVVEAARRKGVFLMEAVWTRFFPLVIELEKHIQKNTIGRIRRSIIEFGLSLNWDSLPETSRIKDPALGAGALLDICIYPLTYSSVIFGRGKLGDEHPKTEVTSSLTIVNGVDESDVVVIKYKSIDGEAQSAICLSTVHFPNPPSFGRIEGTDGSIALYSKFGPSCPTGFRIKGLDGEESDHRFDHPAGTIGFIYEADAVARDIAAGRLENQRMPLAETLRMMKLMDEIRGHNGLEYPQDRT
ncbi:hypothetical protein B0J11DRAFT_554103 [Dendryphion nanum]|uniref:D-xylose 1-dehydrogenase (NADP(+), D-xylono-1,5-lactone-forming) n=1 Tax=Dendryphion nanum TaxID=256645 RepID=A0A9P9D589_9PLEO|nr:hypothetical protein B0J11DRAFT_554103 [Dendryphion nanum]